MYAFPQHQAAALYAAFDLYPSAKGAATHIYYFAEALLMREGGWLHVLGNEGMPRYQCEETENGKIIEITRFAVPIVNYLQRAKAYSEQLHEALASQKSLKIAHFRDIWSGTAIIAQASKNYKTVFEVNALPSVELPYRYPALLPRTLDKIKALEKYCLQNADVLVVPSGVIRDFLIKKGISETNIHVIHNGAAQ